MTKTIKTLFWILVLIVLLSLLWNYFFVFDLLSHFYLQYLFFWVLSFIYFLILKDKEFSAFAFVFILSIWFMVSKSQFIPMQNDAAAVDIDYYFVNNYINNDKSDDLLKDLEEVKPKYIWIVELNKNVANELGKKYKFNYFNDAELDSFWFYTNEKVEKSETLTSSYPVGHFVSNSIHFYLIHPHPPVKNDSYLSQIKLFDFMNEILKKHNENNEEFVLMWDFNSTFYSPVFQKYFWKFKFSPIYSRNTNGFLRLPIDYIITNFEVKLNSWANIGSDHLPIIWKSNRKNKQKLAKSIFYSIILIHI